uniref:LRAT domain-containing protein n=1 Tax=Kryptolebias marmoratus TaxID=37003 RepID=A0A3Q2ZUR1_KRYMA
MGDLIEFVNPWLGLSLWAVYAGDGHVIHFGVGGKICNRVLKKTRICKQRLADVRSLAGTRIRVNNSKHNLAASPQEIMTVRCEIFLEQEFKYDMVNFNSEHFATFVRYGHALSSQVGDADSPNFVIRVPF